MTLKEFLDLKEGDLVQANQSPSLDLSSAGIKPGTKIIVVEKCKCFSNCKFFSGVNKETKQLIKNLHYNFFEKLRGKDWFKDIWVK